MVAIAYSGQVTAQEGNGNASECDTYDSSSVIFVMDTASVNIAIYRQCTVLFVTLVNQCDPYSVFVPLPPFWPITCQRLSRDLHIGPLHSCRFCRSTAWHFKACDSDAKSFG